MKTLIIGGTLFIGRALVRELLEAGHEVTVLHRKSSHELGPEVGNLVADRNDAGSVRTALAGRVFDAVFDNVYDWERGTTPEQVEATALACGDQLTRYVFLSSCAAYGEGTDRREEDALAADDHPIPYVRHKAGSERALFRLYRKLGFPTVTLRPPYVYGPENPFYREAFFWDRLRAGREIILPGDGRRLMQFVYVKDLAGVALKAMMEPRAVGEAFNIADPQAVTQTEAVRSFASAAGIEPRMFHVPREIIERAGGNPMGPPMYFGEYFDMPPITEATEKAQRVLGFRATSFAAGLAETYHWYVDRHREPDVDFSFEDSLMEAAYRSNS